VIGSRTTIRNSVLMGADFYQAEAWESKPGLPPLGIGCRCHIEGAIIDKNARIGEGVVITPEGKPATRTAKTIASAMALWLSQKVP
jgi:glucose-1-phosphate adenylyltransferase